MLLNIVDESLKDLMSFLLYLLNDGKEMLREMNLDPDIITQTCQEIIEWQLFQRILGNKYNKMDIVSFSFVSLKRNSWSRNL